jgi:signal transduction histidine kinase
MLRTNSLAFRIGAIAAGWSLLGLLVGSYFLSSLFRQSAENGFDNRLLGDLESVIAVAELDCAGTVTMPVPLIAERFMNPFSGWYWQIASIDDPPQPKPKQMMRSRSLWDQSLVLAAMEKQGEMRLGYATGPKQQRLRYAQRVVSLPPAEAAEGAPACKVGPRVRIAVAGDLSDIEADIAEFDNTLVWSVSIMGAGLIGLMIMLVRLGLSPLNQVSQSLAAIREGRADHLEGKFPAEIQPLADELNALVAHNAEVVSRARTHVANLAHFLKTPLSVIANEVQGATGPMAESVARQAQVMRRQVDHYLTRARTVASAKVIGARTEAAPMLGDLTRALSKIYAPRGIRIERECPDGLSFRGDRSDFEEMVGNLIDNACKWAEGEVTIVVAPGKPGRLTVTVGDDGPGLTDEQAKRVIERGERLDESKPGSGLGLGIVKEIASLYGGTLTLGRSAAGGLSAVLDLPAVERG